MRKIGKRNLLVAGPTSGKTYLKSLFDRKGIAVTDVDDLAVELWPSIHDVIHNPKVPPEAVQLIDEATDMVLADTLARRAPKLVMTNLWGSIFLARLFEASPVVKTGGIFVARANPLEVASLSARRGTALSTKLATKWTNIALKSASTVFDHVVWLPKDVYLTDVVAANADGWYLTPLGLELSKHDREFALSFNFRKHYGGEDSNV